MLPLRGEKDNSNSVFVTPHQNNKQAFCGHSIDVLRQPKTNCLQCWAFYFIQNTQFVETVSVRLYKGKRDDLVNKFGAKFVKKLEWFLQAVAKAKEVQDIIDQLEIQDTQNTQEGEVTLGNTEAL